jgi:hypothetical protein
MKLEGYIGKFHNAEGSSHKALVGVWGLYSQGARQLLKENFEILQFCSALHLLHLLKFIMLQNC